MSRGDYGDTAVGKRTIRTDAVRQAYSQPDCSKEFCRTRAIGLLPGETSCIPGKFMESNSAAAKNSSIIQIRVPHDTWYLVLASFQPSSAIGNFSRAVHDSRM